MIPSEANRSVEGNLTGTKVQMTVDPRAMAHIMTILTRQYSNPRKAVVREYSTNAYDSHVEAGQTRPIEVTTPTPLSPYLKIVDFGVGLSVDDIHELYSQYGASTKRGTNDATGMLGIGSKSALAYTSQFTLQGTKDGVKVTVAVSRDENGAGSMTIIDTSATDDPNGVEVIIPVKSMDARAMQQEADEFFSYWPKGTVLLNGSEPRTFDEDEHVQLTPDMVLLKSGSRFSYSSDPSIVVMGNVPYPAGDQLAPASLGIPHGYSLVARIPIGSVDFAPSREQLEFTTTTKTYLEKLKGEFHKNLIASVQKEIEQAASAADAVKAVNSWSKVLGSNRPKSFRYKGLDIPTRIVRPNDKRMLLTGNSARRLSSASNVPAVDLDYLTNSVWVTDYTMSGLTPTHKKKMQLWVADQTAKEAKAGRDFPVSNFLLVDFPLDATWIDANRVVSWAHINTYKLPQKQRSHGGRLTGSYDVVAKGATATNMSKASGAGRSIWEVPGSKIDMSKPVFWFHGNTSAASYYSPMFELLADYTIICLPGNRVDKFCRDNPQVPKLHDELRKQYDAWLNKLTPDQKLALAQHDEGDRSALSVLAPHAHKIKDPDVVEAIRVAKIDVDRLLNARRQFARYVDHGAQSPVSGYKDPMSKYPLFDGGYGFRQQADHTIAYMNAAYEGGW